MSFKSFSYKVFQGKDNKIKGSANDGATKDSPAADEQAKPGETSHASSSTTKTS